jgi:DNA-binding response OmpR family regulator
MESLQRILHVEDEEDIRKIVAIALSAVGGFTVEQCASGQEALRKAPLFGPDLILLDVMMPGMDGPTTLQELRKLPETAETPVIFMTAKVQSHEVTRMKDLGAIEIIAKPFDPMTLSEQIRNIWRQYKAS